jgi:hypothetical protein
MKNWILLLLLVFAANSFATTGPFHPYEKAKFDSVDSNISSNDTDISNLQTTNKNYSKIFEFDASAVAAPSGETIVLGTLPANAILLESYFYVNTPVIAPSDNTIAFQCESANDLFTATDLTDEPSGTLYNGAIDWENNATAPQVTTGSDGCNVSAVIGAGTTGVTAGILKLYVEYVLDE